MAGRAINCGGRCVALGDGAYKPKRRQRRPHQTSCWLRGVRHWATATTTLLHNFALRRHGGGTRGLNDARLQLVALGGARGFWCGKGCGRGGLAGKALQRNTTLTRHQLTQAAMCADGQQVVHLQGPGIVLSIANVPSAGSSRGCGGGGGTLKIAMVANTTLGGNV